MSTNVNIKLNSPLSNRYRQIILSLLNCVYSAPCLVSLRFLSKSCTKGGALDETKRVP